VKLIDTSASQIAEQMKTNPEYARAAATKFAHKIIRERVNVDQISVISAAELKSEPLAIANDKEPEAPPISEDWLNAFESEAPQISSEQMKSLFAKVLAGEIRRPTSYSIKTIKLMAQLDNHAASLFTLLCSLTISLRFQNSNILDARVVSMANASANSLQAYGLTLKAGSSKTAAGKRSGIDSSL
jgi:F0F1-type ATP synthase delta subunit